MAVIEKIGFEFLVNTVTAADQLDPTLPALTNGNYLVTWKDFSGTLGDASDSGIKAQLHAADGTRIDIEFLANTVTAGFQGDPQVAALAGGGAVISWNIGVTGNISIKAQVLAADGSRVGGEFLVNSAPRGSQFLPIVAGLKDGGFVIAWVDFAGDQDVKAQLYDAAGVRVGGEFRVNTVTASVQTAPNVTALGNGGFVVTWADASGPDFDFNIKAQMMGGLAEPGDNCVHDGVALAPPALTSQEFRHDRPW